MPHLITLLPNAMFFFILTKLVIPLQVHFLNVISFFLSTKELYAVLIL